MFECLKHKCLYVYAIIFSSLIALTANNEIQICHHMSSIYSMLFMQIACLFLCKLSFFHYFSKKNYFSSLASLKILPLVHIAPVFFQPYHDMFFICFWRDRKQIHIALMTFEFRLHIVYICYVNISITFF